MTSFEEQLLTGRTAHGVSLQSAACLECPAGSYVNLVRRVSA
jgi:hypothetical protein